MYECGKVHFMYSDINILEQIKKTCKERDITVSRLEKDLGWSNGVIGRWAKVSPSIDKLFAVADQMEISLDELLGSAANTKCTSDTNISVAKKILEFTGQKRILWELVSDDFEDDYKHIFAQFAKKSMNQYKIFKTAFGMGEIIYAVFYIQNKNILEKLETHLYLLVEGGEEKEEIEDYKNILKILKFVDNSLYEQWNQVRIEKYRNELLNSNS